MGQHCRAGGSSRVVRAFLVGLALLLTAHLVAPAPLAADNNPVSSLHIRRLSIADGLPDTTVRAIVQDRHGFLWVGTELGLCRYDGYSFSLYRSKPGSSGSLRDSDIATLLVADDGGLWIGTWGGGLQRYDQVTDSFASVVDGLPDDRIQCLFAEENILWVGTFAGGLVRLDRASGDLRVIAHDPDDPGSLSHNRVWSICRGPDKHLWVATEDGINVLGGGLACLKVLRHNPADPTTLSHNNVRTLFVDSRGSLWAGTWQGLNRYDPRTGGFVRYLRDPGQDRSPRDTVNVIREDREGNLLIGTSGELYRLDAESARVLPFGNQTEEVNSLGNNDVRTLLLDRSELLWIGTRGGGLNAVDLKPRKFHHVAHVPGDPSSIADPWVQSLAMDGAGRLWVATARGLCRQSAPGEPVVHFSYAADDPTSLPGIDVRLVLADSAGDIWAATWQAGLVRFVDDQRGFLRFRHDPDDPFSLANDNVSALFEDSRGRLWIGTVGGVDRIGRATGRFAHVTLPPGPPSTMPGNFVWGLAEDDAGSLWIGTDSGGLYRLEPGTESISGFAHEPGNNNSLSSNRVISLLVHSAGDVWVGTDRGLNRFRENSTSFQRLDESDGLPNAHIAALLEDEQGRIWISTHRGLACLDPESETIRTYSVQDGLQGNIFFNGAALRNGDGHLYFGGPNGFNRFLPAMVRDNPHPPPVVITAVRRFDESLALPAAPWATDEIRLTHRDSFFAFEFAALDFTSPADNRYAYRLEGFDRDWIDAGSRRWVSYTNLDPGRYLFRVRGTNNDGLWNESREAIAVIIEPPFWSTWWFRALLAAGLLLLAASAYWLRVRTFKRHERDLAERVDEALASLKRSEQRYRQLFERNLAGVAQMTLDGTLLDCNEAFARMAGPGVGPGCDPQQVVALLGGERGFGALLAALESKGQVAGFETSGKRTDESQLTLLWNATLVAGDDPAAGTIESTVIDLSERRQMEERVRQAHKLESLAVMAGGIAHDFNNILMAILGSAELAQLRLPPGSRVRDDLRLIEREAIRAAELSNQMLACSGRSRYESKPVDLSELARDSVRELRGAVPENVELVLDLNDDLPELTGDPGQLASVISSLVTNAWEAIGDAPGQVIVRTGMTHCSHQELSRIEAGDGRLEEGPYVRLQVEDSGVGMDEHTRARLFDPFFTTKFTGRGLGMAAVLGMVRSHHGAIHVKSVLHQGTTVSVLLPPAAAPAQVPVARSTQLQSAETTAAKGALVLVVDDEPAVREAARGFFEALGCSALTAADGHQGIELFTDNANHLRLVLLDLSMPGMGGGEVLRVMVGIRSEVPVILSSGYGEDAVDHLLRQGAAGFIHKPYGLDRLRAAIEPFLLTPKRS